MRLLRFLLVAAVALTVTAPNAGAQMASRAAPRGTYVLMPDSGYAGPDISGFAVQFTADSTLVVNSPDGSLIVKAKLTFAEGVLTINDLEGQSVCPSLGKYRVGGDDKVLKLKSIEDGCPDRAAIIDFIKFVRQG